jgi:Domain of unknown function (DUF4340)
MSIRALLIVAAALIVLSIVALVSQRGPNEATQADSLLVPDLRARFEDVESIVVRKAGNEIVATLNRAPAGWTIAERSGYPADTDKIRTALNALADARILEQKTSNPALYDRLGLSDVASEEAGGVSLTLLPEDARIPTVILGDSEGTSYRYARLATDDQSYLINRDPEFPKETTEWLVPQIVDVRGDRVERIVITHADGERLELFKTEVGQSNFSVADIPEGRELQYPGVANVTGNLLRDLRLEDVARLEETPPEPEVVTEFTTFDGLIVRVEGLRIDGDGWIVVSARPDTEFARSEAEATTTEESDEAESPDAAAPAADPAAEAQTIDSRTMGWRYRIASYQYDQLARRMSDLLRALDTTN